MIYFLRRKKSRIDIYTFNEILFLGWFKLLFNFLLLIIIFCNAFLIFFWIFFILYSIPLMVLFIFNFGLLHFWSNGLFFLLIHNLYLFNYIILKINDKFYHSIKKKKNFWIYYLHYYLIKNYYFYLTQNYLK